MCEYPLLVAKNLILGKPYGLMIVKIIKISKKYKAELIKRPKKLNTNSALGIVFEYGYFEIKKRLDKENSKID